MKRLPRGYKRLGQAQRQEQRLRLDTLLADASFRREDQRQRVESLVHSGDKRQCPACKAGI